MENGWKPFLQSIFEKRNQGWISGNVEPILTVCHQEGRAAKKIVEEMERFRRAAEKRGITYRSSNTRLEIVQFFLEGIHCFIDLREYIQWLYQQENEIESTERLQHVRLHLRKDEDWKIEDMWVESEFQSKEYKSAELFLPFHEIPETRGGYDRLRAFKYAELWWNGFNPAYRKFDVDCTNYVSQVMAAGGFPMEWSSRRDRGWWYRHKGGKNDTWSFSWAVAHALRMYLQQSKRVRMVDQPHLLDIGDVICYDWDGDGHWQHNTVVVGFDQRGMPLVNAHTVASHRRYWDYQDSYAYTERTQYRFFHILD